MSSTLVDDAASGSARLRDLRSVGRAQATVAGGQILAGAGNLVFVALAARVLDPSGFAQVATFVALLALVNLPGAGLAAAGAAGPERSGLLARKVAVVSTAAGLAVALLCVPLSMVLDLPIPVVLAVAAALPAAPVLGLRRGLAYAGGHHDAVVKSLLAEPATRLVLGLALGSLAGPTGAVWGVAIGGWCALVAMGSPASVGRHSRADGPASADQRASAGTALTGLAFVVLAVLQHQDLVLAHRVLDGDAAGAFAAISAIGGLVAFATATLPMVLLPASRRGDVGALPVALAASVGCAAAAVLLAVVAGPLLVTAIVGSRYSDIVSLVPVYMAGMGALGVARVVSAHRCGRGDARAVVSVAIGVAFVQAVSILTWARTPGEVVAASTLPLVAGAAVLSLPVPSLDRAGERLLVRARRLAATPDARLLVALVVVAIAIRSATERSLWVDEAISIRQAQLPFGAMLDDLRHTDVHPPLHFVVLWVSVRVLGTAEWAVRLPSLLFGVALIPVVFGAARELFDRRTARVAAILAVPAPFLVWYSQEARMYSLFMVIGLAGIWAQAVAMRRGSTGAYLAWAVASAGLVWTQWFAFLPLAVQQSVMVVHLVQRHRQGDLPPAVVRRWLGSIGVTLLLVAPLAPYLADQLASYGERGAGLELPGSAGTDASTVAEGLSVYAALANGLWAIAGYHSDDVMVRLGSVWPLAMLGCLLVLGRRLRFTSHLVLAVAVVPALLLFVIAHSKRDLFELRYFVLSAPLVLLLVARATTSVARSRAALGGLVAGLVALSSLALVDQQLNGTNPRLYDFRGAVGAIESTAGEGDVIAHSPEYLDGVLHYYAPDMATAGVADVDPAEVEGQIYVVVTERFLTPATSGPLGDELARLTQARGAPERIERPNVVVWRFS